METQVKRTSAADEVFSRLYSQITNLEFKVGDRLPTQEDLAARFSVSRNTIREAITKLNVLGLVTTRQGSGTVVTRPDGQSLADIGDKSLIMQPAAVTEFLEARLFVERATVRLAVMRATALDLKHLRENIEAQILAASVSDIEQLTKLDVKFHMTIAEITGNRVLNAFFQTIWERLQLFISEASHMEGLAAESMQAHIGLLERIEARDADGAEHCLVEHLYRVGQGIERNTGVKLGLEAFVDLLHVLKRRERR